MSACPRWPSCSAPLCPLDPLWEKRKVRDDDPICFYLLESVKAGAVQRFQKAGLSALLEAAQAITDQACERWGRIRRQLERATTTGSRLGA